MDIFELFQTAELRFKIFDGLNIFFIQIWTNS